MLDLLFALRQLRRNPGFSFVAIFSLGLGIGAATAMFSAISGILLSPYPYPDTHRTVFVSSSKKGGAPHRLAMTTPKFRESVSEARLLEGGILYDDWVMTAINGGLPESLKAGKMSPNAFAFFGVPALLGQTFGGDSFRLTTEPELVVVLSYRYWQSRFGGSRGVLGQTMRLDRQDYTIIGVMPERFRFLSSDIYVPLAQAGGPYAVAAKIRRGVSSQAAGAELEGLIQRRTQKDGDPDWQSVHVQLAGIADQAVGRLGGVLKVLSAAVSLLLVIGCVNVSILLVARGLTRQHEISVRGALGAGSGRILRQLLTESFVLSCCGGVIGVAAGYGFLRLILHWMPNDLLPQDMQLRMNGPVLIAATILALLVGLASGALPALRFSRARFNFNARGNIGGMGAQRVHSVLIIGQIALTVLLLAGAGAALRTFLNLTGTSLGYEPRNVTTMTIALADNTFLTWSARVAYYERLRAEVASVPGVETAAIAMNQMPPFLIGGSGDFEIPGIPIGSSEQLVTEMASGGYFDALRTPLRRGRSWTRSEESRAVRVAVINEAMAARYWPGTDPIGKRIRVHALRKFSIFQTDSPGNDQWVEVIGVVADSRNNGLHEAVGSGIYMPYTIVPWDHITLMVRSSLSQQAVVSAAKRKVAGVNGDQPINPISSLEQRLKESGWARQEFVASLFTLCAGLAVLLAMSGLYSAVSCSVSQRAREFGLRNALGGSRRKIIAGLLRASGITVLLGLVSGVLLTATLDRTIAVWTESSLFNVSALAPVLLLLSAVALCAVLIPARRAASANPMDLLRND